MGVGGEKVPKIGFWVEKEPECRPLKGSLKFSFQGSDCIHQFVTDAFSPAEPSIKTWTNRSVCKVDFSCVTSLKLSLSVWTVEARTLLFGHAVILFHVVVAPKWNPTCRNPFDPETCGFQRWSQIISNVLPERDKSDKGGAGGWKNIWARENVWGLVQLCPSLWKKRKKRKKRRVILRTGAEVSVSSL